MPGAAWAVVHGVLAAEPQTQKDELDEIKAPASSTTTHESDWAALYWKGKCEMTFILLNTNRTIATW